MKRPGDPLPPAAASSESTGATTVRKERLTSPCLAAAARHFSVHCSISRNKLWNCCGSSDKFSAFALSTNEDGKIVSSQSKMIIALSLLLLLLVDMVTTKCNFERYSIYGHDRRVIKQLSKFLGFMLVAKNQHRHILGKIFKLWKLVIPKVSFILADKIHFG